MCNLDKVTIEQRATCDLARAMRDTTGNLPSLPGIFSHYLALIVKKALRGVRDLAMVCSGMPSSKKTIFEAVKKSAGKMKAKGKAVDFDELLRIEPNGGTTNVRNTPSAH